MNICVSVSVCLCIYFFHSCVNLHMHLRQKQNWSWYSFVIASDMLRISQTKKGISPNGCVVHHLISLMCFSVYYFPFLISSMTLQSWSLLMHFCFVFSFFLSFVYRQTIFFIVFHAICTFVTCFCFIWSFSYCRDALFFSLSLSFLWASNPLFV